MKSNNENTSTIFINPIDDIEEIVSAYDLEFSRNHRDELVIKFNGMWNLYNVSFFWFLPNSLIRVSNKLNLKIPTKLSRKIKDMISTINEKLLVGYFIYSAESKSIHYRHNISLKGVSGLTTEQIEDLIDVMADECDKYFPAFHVFLYKKNDPDFALKFALLETLGEA